MQVRLDFKGVLPGFRLAAGLMVFSFCLQSACGAFNPPVNVNTHRTNDPRDNFIPVVAAGPDGTVIAVWGGISPNAVNPQGDDTANNDGLNEDLYYSISMNGGVTWGLKTTLKTNGITDNADDVDPAIATDGQGRWMVVWRSCDTLNGTIGWDRDILMTFSSNNGQTWSDPKPVNTDAATDGAKSDMCPGVASDGPNHWIVSWTGMEVAQSRLLMTQTTDNGQTWSAPATWATVPGMYYFTVPTPATNGAGRAIITWGASPTGTPGNQERIYYALTSNDGNTWSAPQLLNALGLGGASGNTFPRIVTDKAGKWVIAWSSNDALGASLGTDGDILFSRSADDGLTWSAPAPLNADAAVDGSRLDHEVHLACNGQGTFIACWTVFEFGGNADLVHAVSTDGGVTWTPPQRVSADPLLAGDSVGYGANSAMCVAPLPDNGFIAVWNSNRDRALLSHPWEILGARWPAAPVPVELSGFTVE